MVCLFEGDLAYTVVRYMQAHSREYISESDVGYNVEVVKVGLQEQRNNKLRGNLALYKSFSCNVRSLR